MSEVSRPSGKRAVSSLVVHFVSPLFHASIIESAREPFPDDTDHAGMAIFKENIAIASMTRNQKPQISRYHKADCHRGLVLSEEYYFYRIIKIGCLLSRKRGYE